MFRAESLQSALKCAEKTLDHIHLSLAHLDREMVALEELKDRIRVLTEHPRIEGLLQLHPNFAVSGQVRGSGTLFLVTAGHKVCLTPKQVTEHLDRKLEYFRDTKQLLQMQLRNEEEKLNVAKGYGDTKEVQVVQFGDTIGKVFECGEFFEIVEFEDSNRKKGLHSADAKPKRISKVRNDEERSQYLSKLKI